MMFLRLWLCQTKKVRTSLHIMLRLIRAFAAHILKVWMSMKTQTKMNKSAWGNTGSCVVLDCIDSLIFAPLLILHIVRKVLPTGPYIYLEADFWEFCSIYSIAGVMWDINYNSQF